MTEVNTPQGKFKALIDTGACTTMMSKQLASKLKLIAYPKITKFQAVDSYCLISEAIIPLKITDETGRSKIMVAYILDNIASDLIIGENIISFTHLIIEKTEENGPYELKQGKQRFDYVLKMEGASIYDINRLLTAWYGDKVDLNRLFKFTESNSKTIQSLSNRINMLTISPITTHLQENYAEDYPLLIGQIETFQDTNIDLPEDIQNLEQKIRDKINPELTKEDIDKIYQVLIAGKDSFSEHKYDLGCVPSEVTKFKINIGNNPIPKSKPFRGSEKMKEEMRKIIKEFKENNIIEDSDEGGGAPAFIVPKPNGTWRMVTSYIELNKLIQRRQFPMPNIDDTINQLKGNKYFTTLDLAQGYYQLEIPEEERAKTSFVTEDGCYQYKRLPMGLADAPSYFQEVINKVLGELKYMCCFGYFDDIVVYGRSIDQLCENTKKVLDQLRKFGLKNRVEKLQAGVTSFVCLGHLVSGKNIQPDPKKIERIKNLEPPTSHTQVRSHMGMFNYFSRFIENYAKIAAPLQELVRNKYKGITFKLEGEKLESWKKLKNSLMKQTMLTHFYPDRETKIYVDASAVAVGGILTQKDEEDHWNPIYFFGCKLQKYQYNYRVTEKECAAIVYACRKFSHFLRHKKFTIVTDHHALCELKKTKFKVTRIMRWQSDLSEFEFDVEYLEGGKHPADCFSRSNEWSHRQKGEIEDGHYDKYLNLVNSKDDSILEDFELKEELAIIKDEKQKTLVTIIKEFDYLDEIQSKNLLCSIKTSKIKPARESELKNKQLTDSRCKIIKQELEQGKLQKKFKVINNILYRINTDGSLRYYLPDELINSIFHQYHNTIEAGHFGFKPTINKIKSDFYFPCMDEIIQQKIAACEKCQQYKVKTVNESRARGMKLPDKPFERIQIDMIGKFPKTKNGNQYVLVVVDVLTRFGIVRPVKTGT